MKLVSRVGQNILLALARYEEYWPGMEELKIYGGQGLIERIPTLSLSMVYCL